MVNVNKYTSPMDAMGNTCELEQKQFSIPEMLMFYPGSSKSPRQKTHSCDLFGG